MGNVHKLIACIVSFFGFFVISAQATAFSVSYDQKVTQGKDISNSKVAMKDDMFRIEATAEGKMSVIIRNKSGIYAYMPQENMAMKFSSLDQVQRPLEHSDNYQQYLNELHAERVGSETLGGYDCDVYRFLDPTTKGITKAWVWKEKVFPIRLEMDSAKGKTTIELTNIQTGAAIQDSAFELPAGVQVMDMGSMPGQGY